MEKKKSLWKRMKASPFGPKAAVPKMKSKGRKHQYVTKIVLGKKTQIPVGHLPEKK